jgi:hypothetical protein
MHAHATGAGADIAITPLRTYVFVNLWQTFGNLCMHVGYKREFGPAATIQEFITTNNDDCELPDVHPSISTDGTKANIIYKQPVARQPGQYTIVALQSQGSTWAANPLCCNQSVFVPSAADQFKMAVSEDGTSITAAWVVANLTGSFAVQVAQYDPLSGWEDTVELPVRDVVSVHIVLPCHSLSAVQALLFLIGCSHPLSVQLLSLRVAYRWTWTCHGPGSTAHCCSTKAQPSKSVRLLFCNDVCCLTTRFRLV